jgi:hypothetical protein
MATEKPKCAYHERGDTTQLTTIPQKCFVRQSNIVLVLKSFQRGKYAKTTPFTLVGDDSYIEHHAYSL